jgi:mono/diheme cytochrome c family protein
MLAGGLLMVAAPAHSGDPEAGRVLARAWCAQCHVVEASQTQASDIAPPFAQVANDPAKSRAGIELWLADPHPPMPKLSLTRQQIDDLTTYIESLKTN